MENAAQNTTTPEIQARTLSDDVQHLGDLIDTARNALLECRAGASAAAVERLGIAADVLNQKIEPRTREDVAPAQPSESEAEYRLSDLAITLESARNALHQLAPGAAITAVDSMLQGASASLEQVMATPKPESAPKLATVDSPANDDADDALRAAAGHCDDANTWLRNLDMTIEAMGNSTASEDEFRECLYSLGRLIEPIRADVLMAHRLIRRAERG